MQVSLITVTPEVEANILYMARVSNPSGQSSGNTKLLAYCIKHGHWSIFEMGHMTLEIITSRAIGAQILRHKSFSFQEFSQRYAEVQGFEVYEARSQDAKNRQNSIDDLSPEIKAWWADVQSTMHNMATDYYEQALSMGIAKECTRFILPQSATTKLYMSGSIRSWMHYLDVRSGPETQLEHREIALAAKNIFIKQLPETAKAKGWS